MPNNLEDMDFSCNPLDIMYIYNFVFFQDLNGNFFSSEAMGSNHDFSECTFSKITAQNIVTDYLSLLFIFFWRCLDLRFVRDFVLHFAHICILFIKVYHRQLPRSLCITSSFRRSTFITRIQCVLVRIINNIVI